MKCEECGGDVSIGDWPFCRGVRENHAPTSFIDDSLDYVDEMIAEEPVHFTSRLQRRKFMDKQGLDFRPKLERPIGTVKYVDLGHR
jgi:hypothetical protein